MSRLTARLAKLETRLGTGDSDKITIILRTIVDPGAPDETRHCRVGVLGVGNIFCGEDESNAEFEHRARAMQKAGLRRLT